MLNKPQAKKLRVNPGGRSSVSDILKAARNEKATTTLTRNQSLGSISLQPREFRNDRETLTGATRQKVKNVDSHIERLRSSKNRAR